jgi:enoyl-CoA hydratase/carnithine racemase
MPDFTHLQLELRDKIAFAQISRPQKANALNEKLWFELEQLALWVDEAPEARVLVLSGAGEHFCAGIDFSLVVSLFSEVASLPEGQKQESLLRNVQALQRAFSAFEQCRKPVIAAVHGACIGGGIDLITACDMRYAASDAYFCVKEIDLAIVADIGTLQRLSPIVGEGHTRELAFTGRTISAEEALRIGLINRLYESRIQLAQEVEQLALEIAEKSPLTIRGIKNVLNYSRDHTVEDGLRYIATLNASLLLSSDTQQAMQALMTRSQPTFLD